MTDTASKPVPNPAPSALIPQPPPLTVLPEHQPTQTRAFKPKARNGKIARLPKLERDMVNRMLADAIPQDKIAKALDERGFKVTPRNVSNWATRGYRQWCADQSLLLETRLQQDTLTDFLRDDPTRLPEVGLQIIATRFSQTLLHSTDPDPKQSVPLAAMLCRISHEILKLHKFRDRRRTIGNPGYLFERQKEQSKKEVETVRQIYSGEPVQNDPPPPQQRSLGQLLETLRSALPTAPPAAPAPHRPRRPPRQPSAANLPPRNPAPPPNFKSQISNLKCEPAASPAPNFKSEISDLKFDPTAGPPPNFKSDPAATPQLETPANFKSEISDLKSGPAAPPNFKSEISNLKSGPAIVEIVPLHTPLRFVDNVPQPLPPQACPNCHTSLEYFRDGSPPAINCPTCNARLDNLYGSQIERCPACNHPLPPLLPSGLRPSRVCALCGCGLLTPTTPGPHPPALKINARFCMHCRAPIPWQSEGLRPSSQCTQCRRRLPRVVYQTFQPVSPYPGSEEFSPPEPTPTPG